MASYESSDQAAGSQVSVDTSTTVIKAANQSRRRMLIRNNDATNPVYLNSGTATSSHFIVKAGESVEIRTKATVSGIATGAAVTVHVWEEFD